MPIPTTGTASYELAATLLTESTHIAARIVHGGVPMGPLENCVFGTVLRGIRLTLGAAVLIEKRLQGEAFILGRSLFEDSLRMAQIGYDASNRKGLMLGWHFDSLKEIEYLHAEAKATGQDALLAMLPDEVKADIAAKSQDQLIELHFGLGTWIRNNFGLWQGNAALAQDAGTNEPDNIAGVIIEALWNRLRGDESKRGDNLPASPMPSTTAPSAGSSSPKKRPPKKLTGCAPPNGG